MDGEIHYIVEDAAQVVHEQIGSLMQIKFPEDDIIQILEIQFEYQQEAGLTSETKPIHDYPITIDEDKMKSFILQRCKEIGITIREDELEEFQEKELIYLKMIGALDEEGGLSHLN